MKSLPQNLDWIFENIPPAEQANIIDGWSHNREIVSFRANNLVSNQAEIVDVLNSNNIPFTTWTHWNEAFIVDKQHEYTLRWLKIYTQGKIYIQSLASMIPVLCLDIQEWQKILDMTAAPWSKTTQIASMLQWNCSIVASEKFGIRFEKLCHTIQSQHATNCIETLKIDATDLVSHFSDDEKKNQWKKIFDRVLLDAPCSSDGRIRLTDEKTYKWYSHEKSHYKSRIQYELLEQARKLLKNGGKIVYSTCSITFRENEDVIKKFISIHPEFQLVSSPIGPDYILEKDMNRWYPDRLMEGFFVVILEKKEI